MCSNKKVNTFIDFIPNLHVRATGRSCQSTRCSRHPTWRIQCQLQCIGRFRYHFDLTFNKNKFNFWKNIVLFYRPEPGMNTTHFFHFFPSSMLTAITIFISMCRTDWDQTNFAFDKPKKPPKSSKCQLRPHLKLLCLKNMQKPKH